jgi:hypothetical protein
MAVNELVDYDSKNHQTPLFTDPTENTFITKDPKINALLFYTNHIRSNARHSEISSPFDQIEILDSPIVKERRKKISDLRVKFPHLNGMAQKIFEYQYQNAPVPRSRFCFASTVALISTLIGNKLRVGAVHPNQYIIMIAPSAAGKDYPLNFTKNVLSDSGLDNLVGQGNPVSESGVMMDLSTNSTRIDTIDEISKLLGVSSDYVKSPHTTQVIDFYTEMYTSVGRPFAGKRLKTGVLGKCSSPYINIIGALTPEAFSKTFSQSNITKGFGGRVLFFPDTTEKAIPFTIDRGFIETPKWLCEYANQWRNFRFKDNLNTQQAVDVEKYPQMNNELPSIVSDLVNFAKGIKVGFDTSPLINRLNVMLIKMAMIDSVACYEDFTKVPKISKKNIDWSKAFLENYIKMVYKFLDIALKVDDLQKNHLNDFIIKKLGSLNGEGISQKELTQILVKRGFFIQDIQNAFNTLLKSEIIISSEQILYLYDV